MEAKPPSLPFLCLFDFVVALPPKPEKHTSCYFLSSAHVLPHLGKTEASCALCGQCCSQCCLLNTMRMESFPPSTCVCVYERWWFPVRSARGRFVESFTDSQTNCADLPYWRVTVPTLDCFRPRCARKWCQFFFSRPGPGIAKEHYEHQF